MFKTCENLKVGDKVLLWYGHHSASIHTVSWVGKLHFKLGVSETKYKRSNGEEVGAGAWSQVSVEPLTPESHAACKKLQKANECQELVVKIKAFRLPYECDDFEGLKKVLEALEALK